MGNKHTDLSHFTGEERAAIATAGALKSEIRQEFTTLYAKVSSLDRTVRSVQGGVDTIRLRSERIADSLAAAARPRDRAPGRAFVQKAMAAVYQHIGDVERAETVMRAAVSPATTTTIGWAAELAGPSTVQSFLLSIAGRSAYAALIARTSPLRLDRSALAKVVIGGEVMSGWIAEGQAIGVVAASLSTLTVTPKKIASIAVFSEELAATTNIEAVLRDLLSRGVGAALDAVFFSNTTASPANPAGILLGLTPVAPSAATPPEEAMRDDLRNLVAALTSPVDPVFVVSPDRLVYASAALPGSFAFPIIASTAVPADRVVCIDAASLAALHGTEPTFSASREATINMADPAVPIATGAQGSGVVASPTRDLWQTDTIGLRTTLQATWGIRPGGASYTEPVAW